MSSRLSLFLFLLFERLELGFLRVQKKTNTVPNPNIRLDGPTRNPPAVKNSGTATPKLSLKQQQQRQKEKKKNNNEEKQTTTQGDVVREERSQFSLYLKQQLSLEQPTLQHKKGNPTFDFARGGATNWIFTRTQAPTPELDRGPPQLCAMPHSLKRLYIFRFVSDSLSLWNTKENRSRYGTEDLRRDDKIIVNTLLSDANKYKQQQHDATPNGSAETYRPIQLIRRERERKERDEKIQSPILYRRTPNLYYWYIYTLIYIYIYQHTQKERDVPTLPDSHKNGAISKTQY
eukprot:gene250-124_t